MLLICFVVFIVHTLILRLCFSQKQSANQPKQIQGNVLLLDWKAHPKFQALLKEKNSPEKVVCHGPSHSISQLSIGPHTKPHTLKDKRVAPLPWVHVWYWTSMWWLSWSVSHDHIIDTGLELIEFAHWGSVSRSHVFLSWPLTRNWSSIGLQVFTLGERKRVPVHVQRQNFGVN